MKWFLAGLVMIAQLTAGTILPELDSVLQNAGPKDTIRVTVQMAEQGDLSTMLTATYDEKIAYLKDVAQETQASLLEDLDKLGAVDIRTFWLTSRVVARAIPD